MFKRFTIGCLLILFVGCGENATNGLTGDSHQDRPVGHNDPQQISIFGKYNINNAKCSDCTLDSFSGETFCDFNKSTPLLERYVNYYNGPFEIQENPPKISGNSWSSDKVNFFDFIAPNKISIPYGSKPDSEILYRGIEFKDFAVGQYCTGINSYDSETFESTCRIGYPAKDVVTICQFSAEKINRVTQKPSPKSSPPIDSIFGKYEILDSKCVATPSKYWYKTEPIIDLIDPIVKAQCEQKSKISFIEGYSFEIKTNPRKLIWMNGDSVSIQILDITKDGEFIIGQKLQSDILYKKINYYLKEIKEFPPATTHAGGDNVFFTGNDSEVRNNFKIKYDGGSYPLLIPTPNPDYSYSCRIDCEFTAEKTQ